MHYHWRELLQVSHVFCRDKTEFCGEKSFVATNACLYACFDKTFLFCRDKRNFVATGILLSRQKTCLSRQNFCRDKMILMAAPSNDSSRRLAKSLGLGRGACQPSFLIAEQLSAAVFTHNIPPTRMLLEARY